jgi:hypothetical protein
LVDDFYSLLPLKKENMKALAYNLGPVYKLKSPPRVPEIERNP